MQLSSSSLIGLTPKASSFYCRIKFNWYGIVEGDSSKIESVLAFLDLHFEFLIELLLLLK